MINERFTSRKLIVVTIAFITGITLSYFGKLDQVTANFIVFMTSAYIAGNMGAGLANVFKKSE